MSDIYIRRDFQDSLADFASMKKIERQLIAQIKVHLPDELQ
jgi:hypothetical protein